MFQIRIHWVLIRIEHFRLNTDPDPDQGFLWPKIEKNITSKHVFVKFLNFFSIFCGSFLPSSWIWIGSQTLLTTVLYCIMCTGKVISELLNGVLYLFWKLVFVDSLVAATRLRTGSLLRSTIHTGILSDKLHKANKKNYKEKEKTVFHRRFLSLYRRFKNAKIFFKPPLSIVKLESTRVTPPFCTA